MKRNELLSELINTRYALKNKFYRNKEIHDSWKKRVVQLYQPFVHLVEQGLPAKPSVRDAMVDTVNYAEDVSVQTDFKDKVPSFLSTEETIEYSPEKSIQEKFAEQSFEEKSELMEELPELARPYINMILTNDINLDSVYGVNINENNELGIGNAIVDIDPLGGDILLKRDLEDERGNVSRLVIGEYEGTPGLYSLLFTNNPGYFTAKDSENYKEILFLSETIKKAYAGSDRFSHKFKTIISTFLKSY